MLDSRELLVEVAEQANLDDIYPPVDRGGSVNDPIRIELVATPQGWIARIGDPEYYESDPMPTAHQALEDVVKLLRQFYEAFSVLREKDSTPSEKPPLTTYST